MGLPRKNQPVSDRRFWIMLISYALVFGVMLFLAATCKAQPFPYLNKNCDAQILTLNVQIARYDSLLTQTRTAGEILIRAKDSRIAELERLCNEKLRLLQSESGTLRADRAALLADLTQEALRGRFLGLGRRRALKGILKKYAPNRT